MRIDRIELFNFRQFYGKQEIVLCGNSDADEKMVTVIYGKNGRGKTGLYRAVMFCLYGDRVLDQDRNYDRNDATNEQNIYLVNTFALNQDAETERKGVDAYVRMSFQHEGKRYDMQRGIFAIQKEDGSIAQEDKGVKLTIMESGNTDVLSPMYSQKIEEEIKGILDARVRNYFLFDGERIERLTKVTQTQKKDVQAGIKNLLKIDELYTAQRALQSLDSKLSKDLSKVSTGEYKKKVNEKTAIEEKITTLKENIAKAENEIVIGQNQLDKLDQELEAPKKYESLLIQRKELNRKVQELTGNRDSTMGNLRKFSSVGAVLLARDFLEEMYVDIDDKRARGEVPSEIKKELIEKLLAEMSCICGRTITLGSDEYQKLQEWNRQSSTQAFEQYVMEFYGDLNRTSEFIRNRSQDLIQYLQQLGNIEEDFDSVTLELEKLEKQLEDVNDEDFAAKSKLRNDTAKRIGILEHELEKLRVELEKAEREYDEVKRDVERLSKESNVHKDLQDKLNIVIKSRDSIDRVIGEFVKDVRLELQEVANRNFERLLDDDGKKTLKQIVVNEDYTLEVLDWQNRQFLANISAGQRQVVSLSFITALAQVAGGSNALEMPLFMDTPFGRLSGEHRDNLLQVIPEITPQWVLLVTDEEFKDNEAEALKVSGKWGKFYVLDAISAGVTEIKEAPVHSFGVQK